MDGDGLSPLFTWRSGIAESDLPATRKLVAVMLSLHMNERGGSCFPSLVTLAAETSLTKKTVIQSLRDLEESGWLACDGGRRGRGRSNRYVATVPEKVQPVHLSESGKGVLTTPFDQEKGAASTPFSPLKGVATTPEVVKAKAKTQRRLTPSLPTRRKPDVIWDTLVEIVGATPGGLERGRWNAATKSLKESGATPETLREAASTYRRLYPDCALTPMALAHNWTTLVGTSSQFVPAAANGRRNSLSAAEIMAQAYESARRNR